MKEAEEAEVQSEKDIETTASLSALLSELKGKKDHKSKLLDKYSKYLEEGPPPEDEIDLDALNWWEERRDVKVFSGGGESDARSSIWQFWNE